MRKEKKKHLLLSHLAVLCKKLKSRGKGFSSKVDRLRVEHNIISTKQIPKVHMVFHLPSLRAVSGDANFSLSPVLDGQEALFVGNSNAFDQSRSMRSSRTVKHFIKSQGDEITTSNSLCCVQVRASRRGGKALPPGDWLNRVGAGLRFRWVERSLLIKAEPQECLGGAWHYSPWRYRQSIFTGILRKRQEGRAPLNSPLQHREGYLNGSGGDEFWVNVKWGSGGGRQRRRFHMHDSIPFTVFPFILPILVYS